MVLKILIICCLIAALSCQKPAGSASRQLKFNCTAQTQPGTGCILSSVSILPGDVVTSPPGFRPSTERKVLFAQSSMAFLPVAFFEQFPQLEQLTASEVALQSVPAGSFDKATRLTNLDLSANELSSLPAGLFSKLDALEQLNLENNTLAVFDGALLPDGAPLRGLYLSDNRLKEVRWESLKRLPALETLDVSWNQLTVVSVTKSLRWLIARNNRARTIETDANNFIFVLERLDLSHNEFEEVAVLSRFVKLTHLELSHNWLTSIDFGLFRNMKGLVELSLAHNRLFTVTTTGNPPTPPAMLDVLDLSNNYLTVLPAANASGVSSAQRLYLEGNGLVNLELHENVLNWPRLKSITLGNNDWHCEFVEKIGVTLAKRNIAVAGGTAECFHPIHQKKGQFCCAEFKNPYLDRLVRAKELLLKRKLRYEDYKLLLRLLKGYEDRLQKKITNLEASNQRLTKSLEEEKAKNKGNVQEGTRREDSGTDATVGWSKEKVELQATLGRTQGELILMKTLLDECKSTVNPRTGQRVIIQ